MIILKKCKITWSDSDTVFNTVITLNHAGNEYRARVRGVAWRDTCEMQVRKNDVILFTVPHVLNTMTEATQVAKRAIIDIASQEVA